MARICKLVAAVMMVLLASVALAEDSNLPAPDTRDGKAIADAIDGWWTASMKTREERVAWWREGRFGCFIHWGVYSGPGGEWQGKPVKGYAEHLMRIQRIPLAQYKQEVAGVFDPAKFNADEWVDAIKSAGMKWIVITAKHHDGFAMYPSQVSRYNIRDATPFKRDPMKELELAARRQGLRFGFYYSHAFDWEDPNAPGNDWDYDNPGGDKRLHGGITWYDAHPELLERARQYVDEKAIPQIRELIAAYHPDIMWFDTSGKLPVSEQLRILKAARDAAPNMIINGRCARGYGMQFGDYEDTSDRAAEFKPTPGDWESIPTINESYGYSRYDDSQKPPEYFIRLLAKAAARGGDILMNIGPMGDGRIDARDLSVLSGIGGWIKVNGDSIYGSQRTPLPVQAWGESTLKGSKLYLHVFDWPSDGKLIVGGLKSTPRQAHLLADSRHKPLKFARLNGKDIVVNVPGSRPDPADTVVVLEFAAPPAIDPARLLAAHGQKNILRAFDAELQGQSLQYGDGKAPRAYVYNWTDPTQALHWNVRVASPAVFDVAVRYTTATPADGGSYLVQMGDQRIKAEVKAGAGETDSRVAQIGRITVQPGEYTLEIKPEQIKGLELMRIFELVLTSK